MYVIRNLMCFLAKPKCRVQLADDNLGGEESGSCDAAGR